LTNVSIAGAGITQFGRKMMLKGLSRRITLYRINKPREIRFGGYPENGIQISGIMFDVNDKELELNRVAWETIRIRGPGDKVRYWCCLKKV
jgi:hypothetical protein